MFLLTCWELLSGSGCNLSGLDTELASWRKWFYCQKKIRKLWTFWTSPYNDVVERNSDGEAKHGERDQPDVGRDLGGVRGGERHGGDRARGHGDRETRARARLHLLARQTRGAAHTRALRLVPCPSKYSCLIWVLKQDDLSQPGI